MSGYCSCVNTTAVYYSTRACSDKRKGLKIVLPYDLAQAFKIKSLANIVRTEQKLMEK